MSRPTLDSRSTSWTQGNCSSGVSSRVASRAGCTAGWLAMFHNNALDTQQLMQRIAKRAQEQGRSDDTPEAIAKRLATYAKETAPLLDTYKSRGQLVAIDGVGDTDAIQANIVAALSD